VDEFRAERISADELGEIEAALQPSTGTCNEMGTASTMASIVEALA
jgi:dihydroxyacid dehydratase/phosphogluconate dehydratase